MIRKLKGWPEHGALTFAAGKSPSPALDGGVPIRTEIPECPAKK